jgi:hypothetical protein
MEQQIAMVQVAEEWDHFMYQEYRRAKSILTINVGIIAAQISPRYHFVPSKILKKHSTQK